MSLGYPTPKPADNPTQVQIGMAGEFFGRKYRVVGRALLGEMEGGRVYYWNEYYLETEGEELATLVYEETTLGAEWRWFTMFDPAQPLTASDAAAKSVGDRVNLDGYDARISLVQESQVYHTEGRTPEGVRPGARANYFNAESGPKMVVVSWTGEEMEFYRGTSLAGHTVAAAFGLRLADLVKFQLFEADSSTPPVLKALGVGAAIMGVGFIIWVVGSLILSGDSPAVDRQPAVVKYNAPAPPLKVGDAGALNGVNYSIEGHAEVELAAVGRAIVRHEYFLRDGDGHDALLVSGWKPGANDWLLFTLLRPASPLTPQRAGNVRQGERVNVGGTEFTVDELFRSRVIRAENLGEPGSGTGAVRYGFSGQAGPVCLLVRWNEDGIIYRQGKLLPDREVTGAFVPLEAK